MPEPGISKGLSRPLSDDIAEAAKAIAAIFSGDDEPLSSPSSSAVSDLIYRGLRHWGLAQVRINRLAPKPPAPEILALLAVAWAALHDSLRSPHVVVSESVAAAKKLSSAAAASKVSGFVNAVLRKTLTDPDAAKQDFANPVAKWNAPQWWIQKIEQDYSRHAPQVLDALCSRGSLTVRLVESADLSIAGYIELLQKNGLQGFQVGPAAVVIQPPVAVEKIPGFLQGTVSIQDSAAQQASSLFDDLLVQEPDRLGRPSRPWQILDACAAPGGKSVALAQRYHAQVWAVDQSQGRLARLSRDLPRVQQTLRGSIVSVVGDILDPDFWKAQAQQKTDGPRMPESFDAILLDAPCSASGVARRHPEIPWKRSPQAIAAVVEVQRRMLDMLWGRLKPGGELVFVTCSVFLDEGEKQQQAFLERTGDARWIPSPGRQMPYARPQAGQDQDGFFFAKFKKVSSPHDPSSDASAAVPDDRNPDRPGQ